MTWYNSPSLHNGKTSKIKARKDVAENKTTQTPKDQNNKNNPKTAQNQSNS